MEVQHWGLIRFQEAWDKQRSLADNVRQGAKDTLVLCQHPSVITLGRTTKDGSVLAPLPILVSEGVDLVEIDRGGEATVHNPGQLVGYPIVDLQRTKPDLHWFLRTIEQCIIDSLAHLGLVAGRVNGRTGVWIDNQRKICAIGIHCKQWITTHGFALNVNNDLSLFQSIIPCGITDKGVTSITQELGETIQVEEMHGIVADAFRNYF